MVRYDSYIMFVTAQILEPHIRRALPALRKSVLLWIETGNMEKNNMWTLDDLEVPSTQISYESMDVSHMTYDTAIYYIIPND